MKRIAAAAMVALVLVGCGKRGVGFDNYDVPPIRNEPLTASLDWQPIPPIPRHVVASAASAREAAALLAPRQSPEASVAARSASGVWLRMIDDRAAGRVWLVAEAAKGKAPDATLIRSEAAQRGGCLVAGPTETVGRATVLLMDCS